jgi:hypothetical protein
VTTQQLGLLLLLIFLWNVRTNAQLNYEEFTYLSLIGTREHCGGNAWGSECFQRHTASENEVIGNVYLIGTHDYSRQ